MISNKAGRTFFVLVILGASLWFSGCMTRGPIYKPVDTVPEGNGVVYIYRPWRFSGGGYTYEIYVGDNAITTLYSGGYYPYFSKPGEIEFRAASSISLWVSPAAVTIDVKPAGIYYIKGNTVNMPSLLSINRPHLMVVPNIVGEQEIAECWLIPEPKKEEKESQGPRPMQ